MNNMHTHSCMQAYCMNVFHMEMTSIVRAEVGFYLGCRWSKVHLLSNVMIIPFSKVIFIGLNKRETVLQKHFSISADQ